MLKPGHFLTFFKTHFTDIQIIMSDPSHAKGGSVNT